MKYGFLSLLLLAGSTVAQPLPTAIDCYQSSTQARDIDAYMACFTDDAVMVDVSRTFEGQSAIRRWALNEVIPSGDSFSHKDILETSPGYAKTLVKWSAWNAHYHYWWNDGGKITRMSLQYAD
ncbi:nuclear transport factor 2 family protein [Vibrio hannami]|uniref:nuclear transport factor 2 family protein n=1 Tax=Vibrio hannami TaxID=2717094 RepID=UPI002410462A|nr:nuclear transport factor 2 family protein [Vibrio hannami]MDG3086399.1 nuclear transport factor 2 family protein [Vibrio hannami]